MEENKQGASALPISGIFILLAILGGMCYYILPLKGSRPITDEIKEQTTSRIEDIQARLWQDPFAAIDKYRNKSNPFRFISQTKISKKTEKDKNDVTVLGVMTFGGPYSENAEWRLRMRYAAVSALGRLGYQAEDPEHIGCFNIRLGMAVDSNPDHGNISNLVQKVYSI